MGVTHHIAGHCRERAGVGNTPNPADAHAGAVEVETVAGCNGDDYVIFIGNEVGVVLWCSGGSGEVDHVRNSIADTDGLGGVALISGHGSTIGGEVDDGDEVITQIAAIGTQPGGGGVLPGKSSYLAHPGKGIHAKGANAQAFKGQHPADTHPKNNIIFIGD